VDFSLVGRTTDLQTVFRIACLGKSAKTGWREQLMTRQPWLADFFTRHDRCLPRLASAKKQGSLVGRFQAAVGSSGAVDAARFLSN